MTVATNMAPDGKRALVPSGYKIKKILLRRFDENEDAARDIKSLVVKFTVVESIYSPTLIAKFSIKDGSNLLEEFPLVGQERVTLHLEREELEEKEIVREVKLDFIITEYPLFARSEDIPNLQAYSFSAISEHAYISSVSEISRTFGKENTLGEILKIFKSDLNFKGDILTGADVITRAKGVLPFQKPLLAVEYFRTRTCDKEESPLMVFQRFTGEIVCKTLNDLYTAKLHGTYRDSKHHTTDPLTDEDYKQRASRILECTSDLRFGRVFQSQRGAFASKMNTIDISNKEYGTKEYSYDIPPRKENLPFSKKFKINDASLDKHFSAHTQHVALNSLNYGASEVNSNRIRVDYEQKMRSYTETLETMSHNLRLYGDFNLNAGKIIELIFPRAMDPQEMEENSSEEAGNDKALTGRYLVTAVQHEFSDGEYFIECKVKRDELGVLTT